MIDAAVSINNKLCISDLQKIARNIVAQFPGEAIVSEIFVKVIQNKYILVFVNFT